MKITVEVEDITTFAIALNNAVTAYGDIVWALFIGCQIPDKFAKLKELQYEEVEKRFHCLKDVYKQVEEIERGERSECS